MLLSLISGFVLGIWIGSFVHVTLALVLVCVALCVVLFLYSKLYGESLSDGHRKALLLGACLLFAVSLGFARMYVSDLQRDSTLAPFAGKQISATGLVVEEPDVRETNMKLTIQLREIKTATGSLPVHEKILVTVPLHPEFAYGDQVSVAVVLEVPENIDSDGRTFDYGSYLRARGIWYLGKYAHVTHISSGHGNPLKRGLLFIKGKFTRSVSRVLPEPEVSLLGGLLVGNKQALGKDLLTEFSRAGVSHVVVLSGYNIAIVAESIMAVLAFLPGMISFLIGCFAILLFTMMAGGGASAVRAAIMVLVALFAQKSQRTYSASRALVLAATVMLCFNPLLLIFDPSFQLSILATLGLIFVSPIFLPYLSRVPEKFGLREIISSTIATQVIVLPFLIYNTGVLSLVSLPVNILILGTVPLTMFLGFVTGIVGFISFYLSFIPALFTYIFLWYQLAVVHIGASLPFGAVALPAFSPLVLIFVYLIIFVGLYFLKKKN